MKRPSASPQPQHTIAIHQVAQMLWGLEGDVAKLMVLRRAGISPAMLESDLARVTQSQFARLMSALIRHQRDELWGLGSKPLPLGTFASCCRLLAGCKQIGSALRAGLRCYHALLPDFVPRLVVSDHVAYLRVSPRHPDRKSVV
jgi:hypothetical protein